MVRDGWWEEYYKVAGDPEKAKKLMEREEEIARKYGLPWEDFSLEIAEHMGAKYPPTIRSWDEYWRFVEELAKRTKEEWAEPEGERASGLLRCRFCGAPYAYRENLELHERGCPKRARGR